MNTREFSIDKRVFDRTVVLRSAYAVSGQCTVKVEIAEDGNWRVQLTSRQPADEATLAALEGEFRNALVNEALRDVLMEKSHTVKELIVAKALYGAEGISPQPASGAEPSSNEDLSYIDEELDNYLDDPLGIAVPWEEKNQAADTDADDKKGQS